MALLGAGRGPDRALQSLVGSEKSALRVKSPGKISAVLMTHRGGAELGVESTFLLPTTTMSPPSTRSNSFAATRIRGCRRACAQYNCGETAHPLREAGLVDDAMPLPQDAPPSEQPPMVTMPVPPTPVTMIE